jgi:hypothetical protein
MNTLVVARWNEDTTWTERLPDGWQLRIVQKDQDLPNVGREPASFLWAITTAYPTIRADDVWAFVQGDPFAHVDDLFRRLAEPITWFEPLTGGGSYGTETLWSDADGAPHHPGVPVGFCYERWLGRPFPGRVSFWAGGQFQVSGAAICDRPCSFYERVLGDVLEGDDLVPYALERLWPVMFA